MLYDHPGLQIADRCRCETLAELFADMPRERPAAPRRAAARRAQRRPALRLIERPGALPRRA